MIENQYLIYTYYGVTQGEESESVIYKVARRTYLDFCRRISFQGKISIEQKYESERRIEDLLMKELSSLFQVRGQEEFDEKHHAVCQHVLQIYDRICSQTYGIAQRWVNQTLLHLVVIEANLHTDYWNIEDTRKYFHVPVEQYVLEAATSKRKHKFQNGLNLKSAPLKHDRTENYEMGWFYPGEIQPAEFWDYPEYIEFQRAVRARIWSVFPHTYRDCLCWAFQAYLEVSRRRNI